MIVGELMFLSSNSMPSFSCHVSALARYMTFGTTEHFEHAKTVLNPSFPPPYLTIKGRVTWVMVGVFGGLARIAQSLTDLLKKTNFETSFTEEVLETYKRLKEESSSVPVMQYFDTGRKTELFVDVCKTSIGAVF